MTLSSRGENWRTVESCSGLLEGTVDEKSRADNTITEQLGGEEGGMEGRCISVFFGDEMRRDVGKILKDRFVGRGKDGRILSLMLVIFKNKQTHSSILPAGTIQLQS